MNENYASLLRMRGRKVEVEASGRAVCLAWLGALGWDAVPAPRHGVFLGG